MFLKMEHVVIFLFKVHFSIYNIRNSSDIIGVITEAAPLTEIIFKATSKAVRADRYNFFSTVIYQSKFPSGTQTGAHNCR